MQVNFDEVKVTPDNSEEKYLICPVCAELITQSQVLENCGNGGSDMCMCSFVDPQWNSKENYFEPIYFREYIQYKKIPQNIYEILKTVKNDVKRRDMYRSWVDAIKRSGVIVKK
ncbi:MAG: hypothetical protein WC720_05345 [Candidatus Shapirobacteria bacterium]|jgi:hypothetical protein